MSDRVQQRRDSSDRWALYNPILLEGEIGIELDTHKWKCGDGINPWNDLEYLGPNGGAQLIDEVARRNAYEAKEIAKEAIANTGYFVCETSANEATKVIYAPNYKLMNGGAFCIKFDYGNTADDVVLNINDIGEYPFYIGNKQASSENTWESGAVYQIHFDGVNFVAGGGEQIQSDWNQNDSTKPDYIKNKPTIPEKVTVDSELSETSENPVQNKKVKQALNEKQSTLKSGQNIKTINGQSLLGEGNIQIEGGGGDSYTKQESDAKYQPKGNYQPAGDYATEQQLEDKVDKVIGKGLSTNDYTNEDKEKVAAALTEHQDISGKADKTSLQAEVTRATNAEENLRQLYNNLQQSQPIPVTALPATGEAGKIYRLAGTTSYADYMYSENDLTTPIKMAEYNNAIDDEPTAGSDNLVKSGGILSQSSEQYAAAVYTSSTDNFLDVKNVVNKKRIYQEGDNVYFADNNVGCVISQFIYVGDVAGGQVTVSGYDSQRNRIAVFLSEASYDNTNILDWFNLIDTERTYEVPANAKYLVVCLAFDSATTESLWKNMKVSKSSAAAVDDYEPKLLGIIGHEADFNKTFMQEIVAATEVKPVASGSSKLSNGTQIVDFSVNAAIHNNGIIEVPVDIDDYKHLQALAADTIKIYFNLKANQVLLFKYETDSAQLVSLTKTYFKYKEDSDRTALYEVSAGKFYPLQAAKDVEYFTFYIEQLFNDVSALTFYFKVVDNDSLEDLNTQVKPLSDFIWDIYGSKTNNLLDTKNVVRGIYIDNVTGDIVESPLGVLSRPIFVGDKVEHKMTISGWQPQRGMERAIYFLSRPELAKDAIVEWYNFTSDSSRTITIPTKSQYAIVCLRSDRGGESWGTYEGLLDYSTIKIAFGENVTTDEFVPKYLFNALNSEFLISSASNNILNTSDTFNDLRITDDSPYFVPNDYPATKISGPIYVKGVNKVTFRCKGTTYINTKWIAFTTDTSRTEDSVVSVVGTLGRKNTTEEEVYTISVPNEAVYMYVTAFLYDESKAPAKHMTCAFGTNPTEDDYVSGIYTVQGEKFVDISKRIEDANNNTSDDNYEKVKTFERLSTLGRYLPYSVGSPGENKGLTADRQYRRAHLVFFTDSHIDLGDEVADLQNVQETIEFVNNSGVRFDALIHAGDLFTPWGQSKSTAMNNAASFFNICKKSNVPFLFSKGNHDSNDWRNPPQNTLQDAEWSELIYDYMETSYGFVRQLKSNGQKSSYGYYDITSQKIRVIIVDAQDIDRSVLETDGDYQGCSKYYGGNAWAISNEQMTWIANTALSFSEDGWGVIMVLHQDAHYKYSGMESSIQKLFNMCVAFNNHETYTQEAYTYPDDSFYNLSAMEKDFSFSGLTDKPRIICWLIGHEHVDKYETVNGINMIWTINGSANVISSDDRVPKVIGTNRQNAFDVISIDTKLRKIWMVRYGSGVNCYGDGGDRFLPNGLSY